MQRQVEVPPQSLLIIEGGGEGEEPRDEKPFSHLAREGAAADAEVLARQLEGGLVLEQLAEKAEKRRRQGGKKKG